MRKSPTVQNKSIPSLNYPNYMSNAIHSPFFPIISFGSGGKNGTDIANPLISSGKFNENTVLKKNRYKTGMFDTDDEDFQIKINHRVFLPPLKLSQNKFSRSNSPSRNHLNNEGLLPKISKNSSQDELIMPGPYVDEDYYRLEKLALMKRNLIAQISHFKSKLIRDDQYKVIKEEEISKSQRKSHKKSKKNIQQNIISNQELDQMP